MNVILNIGYDRYITSLEEAAKIMGLLGNAKSVNLVYGYEAEGTVDRFVVTGEPSCLISPINHPIAQS